MKNAKQIVNNIMLYVCLAILVCGIAFVAYVVLNGINKSFEATHDEAKATQAPTDAPENEESENIYVI